MGEQKTALILLIILCFAISTIPLVSASEDSWTTMEPMPTARSGLGVAVVNDELYVIGGYDGDTYLAVNEKYTPADYIPEFPSWAILPLLLVATLAAILYKRRVAKTQTNNRTHSY